METPLILLMEPLSKNIGMYVPAYPLPLVEIASYVKRLYPESRIRILSLPVDYGLPLTREGKELIYDEVLRDLDGLNPACIGISCTAIAQAQEVIDLCDRIKEADPDAFLFVGGYFPTLYYEEMLSRTSSIDLVVRGEGEIPLAGIVKAFERGRDPRKDDIPNLVWKEEGKLLFSKDLVRFDPKKKPPLDPSPLKSLSDYDLLPYAFSRGCTFRCTFCMESYMRPGWREVPEKVVKEDLAMLSRESRARMILVSDALFKSIDLLPFVQSLGMKVNFETRGDVMDPSAFPKIAGACGSLAIGLESASFDTLKRMNKVRNREHYEHYINNTRAIFRQAAEHEIPIMVFMIAGFPGDGEEDLEETLRFAEELAEYGGPGGHVFKIGECRVYPKTRLHQLASSMSDVIFDDQGVFGDNVVRRPSRGLDFDKVLSYMQKIYQLSRITPLLQESLWTLMPFFRFPPEVFADETVPGSCFRDKGRTVLRAKMESLSEFRRIAPSLAGKYEGLMSGPRSTRNLPL
ncbi:MAG: B12-binding domain-containing radical SAM protein [Deltaproteobacteria bacterium]|nr:B12-binding domain-containing radical SAM protein [Deltaproteobacteria bacterium]